MELMKYYKHNHFQSSIVFTDHLLYDDLSDFKLIIIGNSPCISEKEAYKIKEYVHNGGIAYICHRTGELDELGRKRYIPILDDILGIKSRKLSNNAPTFNLINDDVKNEYDNWVSLKFPHTIVEIQNDDNILANVIDWLPNTWEKNDFTFYPGIFYVKYGKGYFIYTVLTFFIHT